MKDWQHGVYVGSSTGSPASHLTNKHFIKPPTEPTEKPIQEEQELETYCKTCGQRKELDFNAVLYRQQYIDWSIAHNIAFHTATHLDTLQLLRTGAHDVLSEILPDAKSTLSNWVYGSYQKRLPLLVKHVKAAYSAINISCDAWKGGNHHNYLAVCSHFIDKDYKQCRVLLGFPRIRGSKSGEN